MRHTNRILPVLALLLIVSAALAQTETKPTSDAPSRVEEIAAARSRYLQTADRVTEDNDSKTLAQVRNRMPGRPSPPQRGHAHQGDHQRHWMDSGNAGHALIGAAIGFGVGALAGAKANKAPYPGDTARAVFLIGGVGALIGGAIGASHGASRSFARRKGIYSPSWPENEEAGGSSEALVSDTKKSESGPGISSQRQAEIKN